MSYLQGLYMTDHLIHNSLPFPCLPQLFSIRWYHSTLSPTYTRQCLNLIFMLANCFLPFPLLSQLLGAGTLSCSWLNAQSPECHIVGISICWKKERMNSLNLSKVLFYLEKNYLAAGHFILLKIKHKINSWQTFLTISFFWRCNKAITSVWVLNKHIFCNLKQIRKLCFYQKQPAEGVSPRNHMKSLMEGQSTTKEINYTGRVLEVYAVLTIVVLAVHCTNYPKVQTILLQNENLR